MSLSAGKLDPWSGETAAPPSRAGLRVVQAVVRTGSERGAARTGEVGNGGPVLADAAGQAGRRSAFIVSPGQVARAHGRPLQVDHASALEDGLGQVVVVQDGHPVLDRLVGGDDLAEDIGGVGP